MFARQECTMNTPLFDTPAFLRSLNDDADLGRQLVEAFLEDSSTRKDELAQAFDRGDAAGAAKLAHSLKGMCGVVRCTALFEAAMGMETSAKSGDLEAAMKLFTTFESMLAQSIEEMRRFLKGEGESDIGA